MAVGESLTPISAIKLVHQDMLAGNHSSNMDQAKDERQKDLAYLKVNGDN